MLVHDRRLCPSFGSLMNLRKLLALPSGTGICTFSDGLICSSVGAKLNDVESERRELLKQIVEDLSVICCELIEPVLDVYFAML